jgi:oligopeptide transport system substrate-binding protein
MPKRQGSLLALLLLLLCFLASLCITCTTAGWLLLQPGTRASSSPLGAPTRRASSATLRLFAAEPRTLDPAQVRYTTSAEYVVEIFSGLVTLNEQLEVVPDLAERWEVAPDGKTYTFYLREEARFHNGRLVTAEDFEYSLQRACDPRTGSAVAGVYLGDIVGAREVLDGRAAEISGVSVLDDHTLSITIDAPKAYFLAKLTYSTAFVVDRDNVEQRGWTRRPNGTGPFRLVEYSTARIVLERNDHFYRGTPRVKQVIFHLSGGAPMSMYENGELDIAAVGPVDVERVRDPANPLHAELVTVPQLDVYYLAFDVTQAPFDDLKVRQAFSLAIDRQKLADVVLKGMARPAQGIVPSGMPGYPVWRERPLLGYDPQRARGLISESAYKDVSRLPPVTLSIGGTSGQLPSHIEAIVAMYRQNLGVEVTVEQSEDIFAQRPQFFAGGWSADYPDSEDFLDILFHSQSELNRMTYSNPQLDRILEGARIETDPKRRQQLYEQAEEVILLDAPWVPLWHSVDYVLTKPYVKGAVFAAAIFPWLSAVYVEE